MQPNIPLGARHHYTTLKIKINQSRRRPTSRSLSKLPVSGLHLQLLSRGRTLPLDSPKTNSPIVEKSKEKVEPSLYFLFLSFFIFFSFSLPIKLFGLKSSLESTFWPHVNTQLTPWITLTTLSIYLGFLFNHVLPHVSYGSHLSSLFDLPCT